jgi:hypothetical protein
MPAFIFILVARFVYEGGLEKPDLKGDDMRCMLEELIRL